MPSAQDFHMTAALVSRTPAFASDRGRYLQLTHDGACLWVDDPVVATPFLNLREAARMSLRLPAAVRAYGVLRHPELAVHDLAESA